MRIFLTALMLLWVGSAFAAEAPTEHATFAGGCFWCQQAEFEGTPGVVSVTAGYTGGQVKNPTYEQVGSGETGHAESIDIVYDPAKVTYEKLLSIYWSNIDPTDAGGQFYDRGTQYRTAIFYHDDEQKQLAEASKVKVQAKLKADIPTQIVAASEFYPAEDYHQDYYKKNPMRFMMYEKGSGREEKLKDVKAKLDSPG
jgi:methionine-S-sulfoxide reductase